MQTDIGTSIFTIIVLILSIIIHEVAHGYAASALGDPTARLAGRLSMNPLRHIDPLGSVLIPGFLVLTHAGFLFGWAKPVPYNPYNLKNQRWGEAIVGGAGVATNILLAVIFALVARFSYAYGFSIWGDLASAVALVNLFLGFFNLIPIPPLDGYTVLRGVLPHKAAMAFRDFENMMHAGGIVTLIFILLIFSTFLSAPFYNFVLWVFRILVGA